MITPQQLEQISFSKQPFGGYDMEQVDEFLEPLIEDYCTLYKDNAVLKSKMRVLVEKLREYQANEESMKEAIVTAQKTCDIMVKEAETKCIQMLNEANATAAENTKNSDAQIEEENARVEEARQAAASQIEAIEEQLRSCLQTLEQIRTANRPTAVKPVAEVVDEPQNTDSVSSIVSEIVSNLDINIIEESVMDPLEKPQHEDLSKAFGKNYDPTKK